MIKTQTKKRNRNCREFVFKRITQTDPIIRHSTQFIVQSPIENVKAKAWKDIENTISVELAGNLPNGEPVVIRQSSYGLELEQFRGVRKMWQKIVDHLPKDFRSTPVNTSDQRIQIDLKEPEFKRFWIKGIFTHYVKLSLEDSGQKASIFFDNKPTCQKIISKRKDQE